MDAATVLLAQFPPRPKGSAEGLSPAFGKVLFQCLLETVKAYQGLGNYPYFSLSRTAGALTLSMSKA